MAPRWRPRTRRLPGPRPPPFRPWPAAVLAGCLGPGASDRAPPFEVETASGGTWNLTDHQGSPVVLDFMATSCEPCRDQSRELKALGSDRHEAALLSVSVTPLDNATDLRDWKADHNATWPHASAPDVATEYGVTSMPTIVVVGADGWIAWTSSGREVVEASTLAEKVEAAG